MFANETDIGSKTVKNQPYFFIIHGWLFTRNIQWVQDMVRGKKWFRNFYLDPHLCHFFTDFGLYVPDVNVCTVDWSKLAYYEYDIASNRNVYDVGNFLAQAITNWKLKLDAVSLLGHTLGAHIAGQTGLVLKGKIAKIFGVDPAGPIFCHPNPKSPDRRLTKDDAKYVQHISTSGGFSGCALESGSQIFYPAGGARQPGCNPAQFDSIDTEICSHLIGTEYFRASLQRQNVFGAKKCKSWFFYLTGLCANGPSDMMGYYANGIPGGFYLDVAKQGPFTKP